MKPARVTIGVPAYNNARTLRASVESLLNQTWGDFALIISDDHSADDTEAVCRSLARSDDRIRYVRQPRNLRYGNFGYLLNAAASEYFMWAPGDDRWDARFVARGVRELDSHPEAVAAVPQVLFEHEGRPAELAAGTYPLVRDHGRNVADFLSAPKDNSRMYGLFRTSAAQRSFPSRTFHAYDWAFSAATLRFGQHREIPEVLMFREKTATEQYVESVRADTSSRLKRALPMTPMTVWLLQKHRIPKSGPVLAALFALNIDKHIDYCERFHEKYSAMSRPIAVRWKRNRWRFVSPDRSTD